MGKIMLIVRTTLILFLIILGLIDTNNTFVRLINAIFAPILGSYIVSTRLTKSSFSEKTPLILLAFLLLIFTLSATLSSGETPISELKEPLDEKYSIDVKDNLKTYYLMENGMGYYTAYANAIINDSRFDKPHTYHWRFPTTFYFWTTLANNANQIRTLYLTFSMFSLVSAYFLLKKFVGPTLALLSPYLLMPYFYSGFFGNSFLFTEWWGLFPFLFGLTLLFYRKLAFATILFLISIFFREHFIVPVSLILFLRFLKTKNPYHLLFIYAATITFFVLHVKNLSGIIEKATQSTLPTIHEFDINLLLSTLRFSTDLYGLNYLLISFTTTVLSLFGLVFYKNRQRQSDNEQLANYALISVFVLFILTPLIGTRSLEGPAYSYYWGITFVPFAILFSPIILSDKTLTET